MQTGDGRTVPVRKVGGLSIIELVFTRGDGKSPQDAFVDECVHYCQEAFESGATASSSSESSMTALGASAPRDASFTELGGGPCTALGACAVSLAGKAYWGSSASALGVALGAAWSTPK